MKNLLIKQSLVLLLVTVGLIAKSQEVQLKYNFIKGKTYSITTEIVSNVTQSMGGQEMKIESGITANSDMTLEDVDKDGSATTLFTLKNATVHSKMAAMGRDTTLNFNDLNEQKRVVLSTIGKQLSETSLDTAKKMRLMGQMENLTKFPELPNKLMKVGEKWTSKTTDSTKASGQNPFDNNTTTEMEYSFIGKEIKDGKELIKVNYSGSLTINGKGNQMGMDLFMEGTGKTEGFAYLDPATFMILYNEANTEMDMSIAVTGQQNMTMPMTSSMKTITKIEEKK